MRVVVIGTGPAGITAAETLRRLAGADTRLADLEKYWPRAATHQAP